MAPLDVELWARRLGLQYPLALLLRALRTDRYLGTALHYLHREIPRSLMLCWAPEVDFFEDLVALADAYATSLDEAVELCVKAAKGELKPEAEEAASVTSAPPPEAAAKPAPAKPKREPRGKSQSAVA